VRVGMTRTLGESGRGDQREMFPSDGNADTVIACDRLADPSMAVSKLDAQAQPNGGESRIGADHSPHHHYRSPNGQRNRREVRASELTLMLDFYWRFDGY